MSGQQTRGIEHSATSDQKDIEKSPVNQRSIADHPEHGVCRCIDEPIEVTRTIGDLYPIGMKIDGVWIMMSDVTAFALHDAIFNKIDIGNVIDWDNEGDEFDV